MADYEIHLYKLPDANLNPNKRLFHKKLAEYKRQAKEELMARIYEQVKRPSTPLKQVHIHTRFIIPDKRRRDGDNLFCSMKSYFDGIVLAGLLEDDASEFVTHSFDWMRSDKADTIVTIERSQDGRERED